MGAEAKNIQDALSFKKEPSFMKYIPYSYHVTDTVISTTNGDYLTIYKLSGRTHDCASDAELLKWHEDLNQLLKSVGSENVKFWTHLHHRRVEDYPESSHQLAFPRMLNQSLRKKVADVPLMTNDLYLTVVYNPVGDATQKVFSAFEKASRQDLEDIQEECLTAMEEVTELMDLGLRAYGARRLGIYYRNRKGEVVADVINDDDLDGLDRETWEIDPEDLLAETVDQDQISEALDASGESAFAYSSALEWLSYLCNGERSVVPVCSRRIRNYLMHNRVVSSLWGDVLQIRTVDSTFYTAGVEIRDYVAKTEPGQFNLLMETPFEFIMTQSFACMSYGAALSFLDKQEKSLLDTGDKGKTQVQELSDANDHITSKNFIMGWHHANVHVIGETPKAAQKYARKIRSMFTLCGVEAAAIGLASEAAYYARLPANTQYVPRPVPINSWNFACFASFHNFMTGKANGNPWGPAVTMVKTLAGTPLFLNFHASNITDDVFGKRPPGHTLILGETGAGKTTLLSALLSESTKFDARMFIYDVGQGMAPLVQSLGGHYTVLRDGVTTGWQPMQMKPTRHNINLQKQLIRTCCETIAQGPIEQRFIEQINKAVDHVMSDRISPHLRTFSAVFSQIPKPARVSNKDSVSLAELFAPWCCAAGGEHAWVFDNETDCLDFDNRDIFGFDLTDFIVAKDQPAPITRTPLLMYLLFRVRESINGKRRCMQVFDELAQNLDDPIIDLQIKRGLKTDRKKDCIYVFATQEPNDAIESRIGKTVVQQCVTQILLENRKATAEDYITGLKLTPTELRELWAIPMGSRRFLYKQGDKSTVAVLDLNGLDREISILSGTPDNAEILQDIIEASGSHDPQVWMPKYFDAVVGPSAMVR